MNDMPKPIIIPETVKFDDPVNAVRDIRRMDRAQKRHNDVVFMRRNKALNCNKGRWDVEPEEDGTYASYHHGQVKFNAQNGRFRKFSKRSKKNTWKKEYDAFDIECADYFGVIDSRMEQENAKMDEEFGKWLIEQDAIDLKAGDLLNEYENAWLENRRKTVQLFMNDCVPYSDINYPNVVYYVDPECIRAFTKYMRENGANIYINSTHDDMADIKHIVGVRTHRNPGLMFAD